ncbi:MAG TPA: hypothetical protein VGA08_02890 [Candidatus Saccharimonadales bacterium]
MESADPRYYEAIEDVRQTLDQPVIDRLSERPTDPADALEDTGELEKIIINAARKKYEGKEN